MIIVMILKGETHCWFYEEHVFTEADEQRKTATSQKAPLNFVVPYTALQMMLYSIGTSSLEMTQLVPAPRNMPNLGTAGRVAVIESWAKGHRNYFLFLLPGPP
jgi:hypothetical protein